MTLADLVPSLIRTYTPVVVAAVVGWLAQIGVVLPEDTSAALATAIGGLAGALYYLVVRLLEQRWPSLGRLLGSAKAPAYAQPAAAPDAPGTMIVADDERQWLLDTRKMEGRDPLTGATDAGPSA